MTTWVGWRQKGTQPHNNFDPLRSKAVHARIDDDADANMILMAAPPENWKRPPGHPHIMQLNTVQRDLRAYNLTLNEAVDLSQNRPLWRLMSTYGATHS